MDQAEEEGKVDIMGCVAKLRHKRCYMVQTLVCTWTRVNSEVCVGIMAVCFYRLAHL